MHHTNNFNLSALQIVLIQLKQMISIVQKTKTNEKKKVRHLSLTFPFMKAVDCTCGKAVCWKFLGGVMNRV